MAFKGEKKFLADKFTYLLNYAGSLKNQGIEVVFFSLPDNKASGFFSSNYLDSYQKSVTDLKKKYLFFDLAGFKLDSTCYRNSDHLNTHGASFVSKQLISEIVMERKLSSLFLLKDSVKGMPVKQNK